MANVSRVNGLRAVKHTNGSAYNGQANLYYVPSSDGTALAVGDPVKLGGSASVEGLATVTKASTAGVVLGVVAGFLPDYSNLNLPLQYRAASTGRYVFVIDSPDVVYEVQEDAVGGALAVADIGLNVDFIDAGVSTTTGASGVQLDTSTKATTATLPFKLLGFAQRVDNEVGSANAKVLVAINNHQLAGGTGTAGV